MLVLYNLILQNALLKHILIEFLVPEKRKWGMSVLKSHCSRNVFSFFCVQKKFTSFYWKLVSEIKVETSLQTRNLVMNKHLQTDVIYWCYRVQSPWYSKFLVIGNYLKLWILKLQKQKVKTIGNFCKLCPEIVGDFNVENCNNIWGYSCWVSLRSSNLGHWPHSRLERTFATIYGFRPSISKSQFLNFKQ